MIFQPFNTSLPLIDEGPAPAPAPTLSSHDETIVLPNEEAAEDDDAESEAAVLKAVGTVEGNSDGDLDFLSTDVKLDWKKDPLTEKLKDFSMVGKKE